MLFEKLMIPKFVPMLKFLYLSCSRLSVGEHIVYVQDCDPALITVHQNCGESSLDLRLQRKVDDNETVFVNK